MSKTVADLFAYVEDPSTTETQKFVRMFDKLFDCLNVRDLHQWVRKCKPDLKPYHKVDDERFEVSLHYILLKVICYLTVA